MAAWGKQPAMMMGSMQQTNRNSAWGPPEDEETALKLERMGNLLSKKLGPEYLSTRAGAGGGKMTYVEGWRLFNLANEVFGFNGWSTEVKSIELDFVDYNEEHQRWSAGVTAVVRVTLADGAHHEDVGYGKMENCKSKGDALDKIKKEAVTDATKRALRSFGNLLGACTYDKGFLEDIGKMKPAGKAKFSPADLHRPGKEWPDPVKKEAVGMKMEVDGEPSNAAGPVAGPSNLNAQKPVNQQQSLNNQQNQNRVQNANMNNARPIANNTASRPQQAAPQANHRPPAITVQQNNNNRNAPTHPSNIASTSKLAPPAPVNEAGPASDGGGSEDYFAEFEDAEFAMLEGGEADDSGFVDTTEDLEAVQSKPKPMQNISRGNQPDAQMARNQDQTPPRVKPIPQHGNSQAKILPPNAMQAQQGRNASTNNVNQANATNRITAPQPQRQPSRPLQQAGPLPQARGANLINQQRAGPSKPPSQPIQAATHDDVDSTYLDGGAVEGGDMLVGPPPADGEIPIKVEFGAARAALKRGIDEMYDEQDNTGANDAGLLAPPAAPARKLSPVERSKLMAAQKQQNQNQQVRQQTPGQDPYREKREAALAKAKRAKTGQGQSSGIERMSGGQDVQVQ